MVDAELRPSGLHRIGYVAMLVFLPVESPVLTEQSVQFDDVTYVTHDEPVTTDLPMVVLTDRDTASSAEIVSGALHDAGRATLMGARTFGKGRIQDVAALSTSGAFKFTIAQYLTPSGFALDRVGITPDVATVPALFHGVDVAYLEAVARLTS